MAIPITNIGILRVLMQIEQNLTNLQRRMNDNAVIWKTKAEAEIVPIDSIKGDMNRSALNYQIRLDWLDDFQTNNPVDFPRVVTMWGKFGGTSQEFSDVITPLKAVADQLGPASKETYTEIITICDLILTNINKPLTLWPE